MNELSREAQSIIDDGRDTDSPNAADRQRVRAALFASLALPTAGTSASTATSAGQTGGNTIIATTSAVTPAATVGAGIAIKIAAGIALIGALSFGTYVVVTSDSPRTLENPTIAPTVAPAPPPAPATETAPTAADGSPEAPAVAPTPPVGVTATTASAPRKPGAKKSRAKRAPTFETLRAEKKLIADARRALDAGDAHEALRLLDQHRRKFKRGQLSSERSGSRVLVLCKLGRTTDAHRAAKRFNKRWPNHPMAARVRAACP